MMQGTSFEKQISPKALSRRADPSTSREAARKLVKSGAHKEAYLCVHESLKKFPKGANANEISADNGMLVHVIHKRLNCLKLKGMAFKTHQERDGQMVWMADEC